MNARAFTILLTTLLVACSALSPKDGSVSDNSTADSNNQKSTEFVTSPKDVLQRQNTTGQSEFPEFPEFGYPEDANVVNVKTKYHAKGDGITDDTAAILTALRENNISSVATLEVLSPRTIFFPAGTYLISNTIYPEDKNFPGSAASSVRILGAGKELTTIKLIKGSANFGPNQTKYVVQTGNMRTGSCTGRPNCGFGNYIQDLTIDTGSNNPGAVGVRFDVANMGSLQNVRIRSGDGHGKYGLLFDSIAGPGYVNHVEIDGFSVGVHFDQAAVNNIVFDDLSISNASMYGIENGGKNIQILDLKTFNTPIAIKSHSSFAVTVVINAYLSGTPDSPGAAPISIEEGGFFFGRNLVASKKYGNVIDYSGRKIGGVLTPSQSRRVNEWSNAPARRGAQVKEYGSLASKITSMNLEIKNPPKVTLMEKPNFGSWANVKAFGAKADGVTDDTDAFQAAVDSGRPIVYVPYGRYVINGRVFVRKQVQRIDFLFSHIRGDGSFIVNSYGSAAEFEGVSLDNLIGVGIDVIHNSNKSVTLKNVSAANISVGGAAKGDFFIENVGPRTKLNLGSVKTWIRQLNREMAGVVNRGGTVWLLGDNLEGKSLYRWDYRQMDSFITNGGGQTEVLGGAIDPMSYYGENRELKPIYSAESDPDDPSPSRISVVTAGLSVPAKHTGTETEVGKIDGRLVFGSWEKLVLDRGQPGRVFFLSDSQAVKVIVQDTQERVFLPLYTSP